MGYSLFNYSRLVLDTRVLGIVVTGQIVDFLIIVDRVHRHFLFLDSLLKFGQRDDFATV